MIIGIEVTDADLDGIIVTAAEGSINYWADLKRYRNRALDNPAEHPEGCSVEVAENEPDCAEKPGWHKVDRALISEGLKVCAVKYPHQFRAFLASGEPGDYAPDAEVCDVLVQCGLFGQIVYG